MVGFGYIFELKEEVKSMQKQPSCIKGVRPSKSLGEKSYEIKGGGHEMAAMMWMIINFNNSLRILSTSLQPHFMADTFDFITFFTQAF